MPNRPGRAPKITEYSPARARSETVGARWNHHEGYDIAEGPRFSKERSIDAPLQRAADMMLRAIIVILLLAAIVVPVVIAEVRRARPRGVRRTSPPKPVKPESSPKPQLRLVVNKNDMDRELAALLAQNARKPSEGDE